MRGAPPLQRAYFGACVAAVAAAVTIKCGSPVPDSFAHVAGRAVDCVVDECDLEITKAVTFEAGVVIGLTQGRSIRVRDGGSLRAVGSAGSPIVLKRSGARHHVGEHLLQQRPWRRVQDRALTSWSRAIRQRRGSCP